MKMTVDPDLLKAIEKTVEEKFAKSLETVQLSILRKEFLTREEFINAMNRLDKKFESMQEQMDKRFESMQEQMDKRFESMQEQMDKRFESMQEQMDKRFEAQIEQMNKGFEDAKKDRVELRAFISKISSQRGFQLEKAVLDLLKDKLIKESIIVGEIKKENLVDREGNVFIKDYNTDIDILIQDGKIILIEIKAGADNRDINELIKKAKLYKLNFKKNYDILMLLCLEINQTNFEFAIKHGIKVIAGEIV